jgi:hypothetical protein
VYRVLCSIDCYTAQDNHSSKNSTEISFRQFVFGMNWDIKTKLRIKTCSEKQEGNTHCGITII